MKFPESRRRFFKMAEEIKPDDHIERPVSEWQTMGIRGNEPSPILLAPCFFRELKHVLGNIGQDRPRLSGFVQRPDKPSPASADVEDPARSLGLKNEIGDVPSLALIEMEKRITRIIRVKIAKISARTEDIFSEQRGGGTARPTHGIL